MKQKIFLAVICLMSFFFTNCSSLIEGLLLDEYRRAGMSEEILNEKEREIKKYFQDVEKKDEDEQQKKNGYEQQMKYEREQQMKKTFSEPDMPSFSKILSVIRIDSTANVHNIEVDEQVNKFENNISSLLTEKNIHIISDPSDAGEAYIVDINCYFNEISHAFIKIDISIINKSKFYHSNFSVDLENGLNDKEKIMTIEDLSQICSEKIYLLLTE